jgi:geranylgeranyl pyrophosphate synthase
MADNPTEAAGSPTNDAQAVLSELRQRVDVALAEVLPPEGEPPAGLHVAMRYSVLADGKRLRPILVLAAGAACGAPTDELLPAACAVELIHAYSLIHDDLPAFDDDSLRRGKPTSHVVFGEPQAILAGDALQSLAFATMAHAAHGARDPRPWTAAIAELADAAGSVGMAGGQWLDVEAEGRDVDLSALETLHAAKTGALLTACARIGAILAGADGDTLERLSAYGRAVGLAFQVVDDILDVEGSVEELGKNPGVDAHRGKPTYPALLGLEEARATAQRLRQVAHDSIAPLGEAARPLQLIADFIIDRSR